MSEFAKSIDPVNSDRLAVLRIGVNVLGLATVAAGILDLIWGDFDAGHQPIGALGDHIPGRMVFAYITAVFGPTANTTQRK